MAVNDRLRRTAAPSYQGPSWPRRKVLRKRDGFQAASSRGIGRWKGSRRQFATLLSSNRHGVV